MKLREIKELRLSWDRNIFPKTVRLEDGYLYTLDKIVIPPPQAKHVDSIKKVHYKRGTKVVILTSDGLDRIDTVFGFCKLR